LKRSPVVQSYFAQSMIATQMKSRIVAIPYQANIFDKI